jgi:hypothetical protein
MVVLTKQEVLKKKREERELKTCRKYECQQIWHNQTRYNERWLWCEFCNVFGLCWEHAENVEGQLFLQIHEDICSKN